jgi:hypothetical protein
VELSKSIRLHCQVMGEPREKLVSMKKKNLIFDESSQLLQKASLPQVPCDGRDIPLHGYTG